MAQGFDAAKPKLLDPLASEPVRINLTALATTHSGPSAPADPQEGWQWMDTSIPTNVKIKAFISSAWITILENIQAGPPSNLDKFVHTQSLAASPWVVSHALGTVDVSFVVYNASGAWITPTSFQINDANTVTITFGAGQTGKAVIIG